MIALGLAILSLAGGHHHRPRPDAAPAAHGAPATILPLCPPLAGIPSGWWVAESQGNHVICIGPNR